MSRLDTTLLGAAFVILLVLYGGAVWHGHETDVRMKKAERDLEVSQSNYNMAASALSDQNDRLYALSKDSAANLAAAQAAVDHAQKLASKRQQRVDQVVAAPIKGNTVCERVLDVDGRFMESLK